MGSNIHGISCTANNYLKQAWHNIKKEHEKNQTYSITLFENTLVCFMRLYKEIRRQKAEDYIPCLECESLEKEFEEMQNDNDLSLFMRTLRTNKSLLKLLINQQSRLLLMLHFVISGKMLRHYLALICNLTTKFRVWVVICHGAFCFLKNNSLIVA